MIMIRKMTNAVLISMLTGAMAILISGCSNNSTPLSTKSISASTNTQAASSENTIASDIATTADDSAESVTSIKKDGYLAIPIADLSQTASFYKADLDGTEVEIVALKDSKGNLRTAFNACQVCYGSGRGYYRQEGEYLAYQILTFLTIISSGRGYYRQEGEYLVCQNCGNSFTIDQVGIASGGCNPWPILDSDRTVTDDEIQISYDVLKATADELPKFFQ